MVERFIFLVSFLYATECSVMVNEANTEIWMNIYSQVLSAVLHFSHAVETRVGYQLAVT